MVLGTGAWQTRNCPSHRLLISLYPSHLSYSSYWHTDGSRQPGALHRLASVPRFLVFRGWILVKKPRFSRMNTRFVQLCPFLSGFLKIDFSPINIGQNPCFPLRFF